MLGKKEMKQLVQDWLSGARGAELIDSIEFKKDVETALYSTEHTKAGDVLLVYKVHTGELVCEPLVEMVDSIIDATQRTVIFTGVEARRFAERLVEGADAYGIMEDLELEGMPRVLAEDVVESVMSSDLENDNVFEEFLNLLNEYVTIQW